MLKCLYFNCFLVNTSKYVQIIIKYLAFLLNLETLHVHLSFCRTLGSQMSRFCKQFFRARE